jgi:alcohol dehydrogenase class IV
MQTGMAFAASGLGAVHGIGHPAGSIMHIPHGVCCAILLPAVLKFNLPACRERFEELARALDFASPEALISEVIRLRREVGLPENFRSYGFQDEYIPFIVKNCRSGSMKCNPRAMSDDEAAALLKELAQ